MATGSGGDRGDRGYQRRTERDIPLVILSTVPVARRRRGPPPASRIVQSRLQRHWYVARSPRPRAGGQEGRVMPDFMPAVVCHGPHDYQVRTGPGPQPGPGGALVKVEAVGICASDLKCYHGAPKFWGDEHRPAYAETEVIPGHEFAGTVVGIDEEARGPVGRQYRLTVWSRSRSSPAGGAVIAAGASTGCAHRTTFTASSGARRAPWPRTWCSLPRRSCTGSRPTSRLIMPPSRSRWPARSTPSSAPVSPLAMSWSWPVAGLSGWAWSWAPRQVPGPRGRSGRV